MLICLACYNEDFQDPENWYNSQKEMACCDVCEDKTLCAAPTSVHAKVRPGKPIGIVYRYEVKDMCGRNVLAIHNVLNTPSITDGLPYILKDVEKQIHSRIGMDFMVVYEPQSGVWDGYEPDKDNFILLQASSVIEAVQNYITHQLNIAQYEKRNNARN